jgi:hypothetical protein
VAEVEAEVEAEVGDASPGKSSYGCRMHIQSRYHPFVISRRAADRSRPGSLVHVAGKMDGNRPGRAIVSRPVKEAGL